MMFHLMDNEHKFIFIYILIIYWSENGQCIMHVISGAGEMLFNCLRYDWNVVFAVFCISEYIFYEASSIYGSIMRLCLNKYINNNY